MVGKVLYWVAVVAISLALVVALIIFFESRDDSSLDGETSTPSAARHLTVDRLSRD